MKQSMLTTTDNPFDPFDQWDDWYAWDERNGYHTPSYLARIAVVSHDLSDADQEFAVESAIDEIVEENINGMYKKVSREIPDDQLVPDT
jgi:hypothetical protein